MSSWLVISCIIAFGFLIYALIKIFKDRKLGISTALGFLGLIIPIIIFLLEQSAVSPPLVSTKITPSQDIQIPIGKYANDNIVRLFPDFPVGEFEFDNTKFLVLKQQSKVSTQCGSKQEWPEIIEISSIKIIHPKSIKFLIAAGYAYADDYEGEKIGEIELLFESGDSIKYDLVLGVNIREWRLESEKTVSEVTNGDDTTYLEEAYRGIMFEGNQFGILDMLTLLIPDEQQAQTLVGIIVKDVSLQEVNSHDPCYFFVAITVET